MIWSDVVDMIKFMLYILFLKLILIFFIIIFYFFKIQSVNSFYDNKLGSREEVSVGVLVEFLEIEV